MGEEMEMEDEEAEVLKDLEEEWEEAVPKPQATHQQEQHVKDDQ